ncbi:MAG: putative toxin-antitoxin system toxin component, PIN family, partial [candidate division NC10 bacterium]|nr:putative toxin-antitoxin system toxin component, PIN family [candidate division NC10 bacterium]
MFKVVYDTNVVVAGLLNPDGLPALLLDLVFQRRVRLFISAQILEEYEGVLLRPR